MADNKAEAKKMLQTAVSAQQTAMSTLKDKMHARIKSTDEHVAQNGAQMVENAKSSHKALEAQVAHFDTKVAQAASGAAAGRSKLLAQLQSQDKKTREMVSNKIKVVIMQNAAQFAKVEGQMAKDREAADRALMAASGKMTASLNAEAALRDEQFQKTVKDIDSARAEATERVKAAKLAFKSNIVKLRATINDQVTTTKNRMTKLSGTVEKSRLAQAKINANVAAETKRMIALGNKRYSKHLKNDAELRKLINANKAATDLPMQIDRVHSQLLPSLQRMEKAGNSVHSEIQGTAETLAKMMQELSLVLAEGKGGVLSVHYVDTLVAVVRYLYVKKLGDEVGTDLDVTMIESPELTTRIVSAYPHLKKIEKMEPKDFKTELAATKMQNLWIPEEDCGFLCCLFHRRGCRHIRRECLRCETSGKGRFL